MHTIRRYSWAVLLWASFAAAQAQTYSYDATGRLVRINFGDGTRIVYQYDTRGNLLARRVGPISTLRGDANEDSQIDVSDVIYLIHSLFAAGAPAGPQADANSDGQTSVADIFFLINYLFANGPAPAP